MKCVKLTEALVFRAQLALSAEQQWVLRPAGPDLPSYVATDRGWQTAQCIGTGTSRLTLTSRYWSLALCF